MPPQIAADRHYRTRRADLGHYLPRRFGQRSRHRFDVARRRSYLGQIGGTPSPWQAATIDGLIALEWAALVGEADGGIPALRESREHRRLFQRLLADFEKTVQSLATAPVDPMEAIRRLTAGFGNGGATTRRRSA